MCRMKWRVRLYNVRMQLRENWWQQCSLMGPTNFDISLSKAHWCNTCPCGQISTLISLKKSKYPKHLQKTTRREQKTKMTQKATNNNTETVLAQSSKGIGMKPDWDLGHNTCFHCGSKGHYAKDCKMEESYMHTVVTSDKYEYTEVDEHIFHQVGNNILSKDWHNQSTVDQFVNSKYLTSISNVDQPMTVYCNAGNATTNQKRMFGKFRV